MINLGIVVPKRKFILEINGEHYKGCNIKYSINHKLQENSFF